MNKEKCDHMDVEKHQTIPFLVSCQFNHFQSSQFSQCYFQILLKFRTNGKIIILFINFVLFFYYFFIKFIKIKIQNDVDKHLHFLHTLTHAERKKRQRDFGAK